MRKILLNTVSVTELPAVRIDRKPLGRAGRKRVYLIYAGNAFIELPFVMVSDVVVEDVPVVINAKEGGLLMEPKIESIQPSSANEGAKPSRKSANGAGYKLHLVLDTQSYARFVWLQGALRAASEGEVIRRALDAYQIFDPEGLAVEQEGVETDRANSASSTTDPKHLYVNISDEMKAQLDQEKSVNGRTYKATIRRALSVLTQLVRERAALADKLKKGENIADEHYRQKGHTPPVLLASV